MYSLFNEKQSIHGAIPIQDTENKNMIDLRTLLFNDREDLHDIYFFPVDIKSYSDTLTYNQRKALRVTQKDSTKLEARDKNRSLLILSLHNENGSPEYTQSRPFAFKISI